MPSGISSQPPTTLPSPEIGIGPRRPSLVLPRALHAALRRPLEGNGVRAVFERESHGGGTVAVHVEHAGVVRCRSPGICARRRSISSRLPRVQIAARSWSTGPYSRLDRFVNRAADHAAVAGNRAHESDAIDVLHAALAGSRSSTVTGTDHRDRRRARHRRTDRSAASTAGSVNVGASIDAVHRDADVPRLAGVEHDPRRRTGVVVRRIAALARVPVLLGPEQDGFRGAEAAGADLVDVDDVLRARRESRDLEACRPHRPGPASGRPRSSRSHRTASRRCVR